MFLLKIYDDMHFELIQDTGMNHGNGTKMSKLKAFAPIVLVAALVAAIFMLAVPSNARSCDAYSWEDQALLMQAEVNPYQANSFFCWPPFWMQCVFVMGKIATLTHLPFFRILQITLVLAELVAIWVAMDILSLVNPTRMRRLFMIGVVLNPVMILLTLQHCNFDIPAIWILLAIRSLIYFYHKENPAQWLCACFFLGMGVLTKTFPLALFPILAHGFRRSDRPMRFIGAILFLGPVALGMSIIYCMSHNEVLHNVLEYRGGDTAFGFPGVIRALNLDVLLPLQKACFYLIGAITLLVFTRHFSDKTPKPGELILFSSVVLLAVPTLGPGGAPQYFSWFLILLVLCYAIYPELRKTLTVFFAVAAVTYIVDYGLMLELGWNWLYLISGAQTTKALPEYFLQHHSAVVPMMEWLNVPAHRTVERLPLFFAMLYTLYRLAGLLNREMHSKARQACFGILTVKASQSDIETAP